MNITTVDVMLVLPTPDARAKYEVVAGVLAAAQRNHMRKIGFVDTSDFRE